jgi:hypothetical protein
VAYTIISELSRLRQENCQVPSQLVLNGEFKAIQACINKTFLKNVTSINNLVRESKFGYDSCGQKAQVTQLLLLHSMIVSLCVHEKIPAHPLFSVHYNLVINLRP